MGSLTKFFDQAGGLFSMLDVVTQMLKIDTISTTPPA
jgi:hypothetical protein